MITELLTLEARSDGVGDVVDDLDIINATLEQLEEQADKTSKSFKAMNKGNGFGRTAKQIGKLGDQSDKTSDRVEKLTALFKNHRTAAEELADAYGKIPKNPLRSPRGGGRRGGGGGGGGGGGDPLDDAKKKVDAVTEALNKLRENRALNTQLLASKEFRQEMELAGRQAREIQRLQESWGERGQRLLEIGENITGTIDLLNTATEAGRAFFDVLRQGASFSDLNANLANIGFQGPQAGGLITQRQSLGSAAAGFRLGLGQDEIAGTGQIIEAAARQGEVEEKGTARELAAQFSSQIQEELASLQIGDALALAGVKQERYEAALREAADAQGVGVDVLDNYTKRQVLLTTALEASGQTLTILSERTTSAYDDLAIQAQDFGTRIAESLAKDFSGGISDTLSQTVSNIAGVAGFGSGTITANQNPERLAALSREAAALEERRAVAEQTAASQAVGTSLLSQAGVQSVRGDSGAAFVETQIAAAEALRDQIRLQQQGVGTEEDRLIIARDILDSTKGLSNAQRTRFLEIKNEAGITDIINRLRGQQLELQKQDLQAVIAKNERELATNDTLTLQEQTKLRLENIDAARLLSIAEQTTTYERFFELANKESSIRERSIAQEEARVAELQKQVKFLSSAEKEQLKAAQNAVELARAAERVTSNVDEQNTLLARGVALDVFSDLSVQASNITQQLGLGKVNFEGLVGTSSRLLDILNTISGSRILTFENIAGLIGGTAPKEQKPKAPPRRRGGGRGRGRGDRQRFSDELQFQANLLDLSEIEQAQAKAFRTLRQNIERNIEGLDGLRAATKLYRAELEKINTEAARGRQQLQAQFDDRQRLRSIERDPSLGTGEREEQLLEERRAAIRRQLSFELSATRLSENEKLRIRLEAQQKLISLEDEAADRRKSRERDVAAFLEGLRQDQTNRTIQDADRFNGARMRIEQLREERDMEIRERELTGQARVQVEAHYAGLILQQQREMHLARMDEERQRGEELEVLASSFYEARATRVTELEAELAEQQRGQFEAGLGDNEQLEGFQAFDRTTLSIIENVDRAQGSLQGLGALMRITSDSSLTGAQKVGESLAALGQVTGGLIGNVKARAAVLGAFEVAQAAAAAARFQFLQAAAHGLAATKFFALSGSGGGGGTTTSTARRERRERDTLTSNDVQGGLRNNQRRQQTFVNVIVSRNDGRAQVSALNELGQQDSNVQVSSSLVSDGPFISGY